MTTSLQSRTDAFGQGTDGDDSSLAASSQNYMALVAGQMQAGKSTALNPWSRSGFANGQGTADAQRSQMTGNPVLSNPSYIGYSAQYGQDKTLGFRFPDNGQQ